MDSDEQNKIRSKLHKLRDARAEAKQEKLIAIMAEDAPIDDVTADHSINGKHEFVNGEGSSLEENA